MNTTRTLSFGGFTVEVPPAWERIKDTWGNVLDERTPPYSLIRPSGGIGVLQLSPALYKGGPEPEISSAELLKMAENFGRQRNLGASFDQQAHDDEGLAIGALSYHPQEKFIRLWFCSDGKNFVFCTYGSDWGKQDTELPDCDAMARSVRFTPPEVSGS
jgi:hypothetical protein